MLLLQASGSVLAAACLAFFMLAHHLKLKRPAAERSGSCRARKHSDDLIEQPGKLGIGEVYPVELFEFVAEVFFECVPVTDVGAVGVFEIFEFGNQALLGLGFSCHADNLMNTLPRLLPSDQCPKFSSVVTQLLNNGQASRIFGMPIAAAIAMPVEVFLNRFESFTSLWDGAVVE